ncbi:MAG: hypothetical protein SGILL_002408, partial [Bacillariaceae sp.]
FEYPANDDSSQIDSEKVTLGQRKNQLSRRLRLAKKQQNEDTGDGNSPQTQSARADSATNHQQAKKQRSSFGARALQMKRDADLTLDESDFVAVDSGNMAEQNKRPRIAKNHPDFAPLIVPPASFRGAGNFDQTSYGNSSNVSVGSAAYAAANSMMNPMGSSSLSSEPFFDQQFTQPQPPRASAVAVSSLTSTAQAVGLTLEQMALALSSNTTSLAKLIAETKSGESLAKQEDLALKLYETESKALYTKCMLMSGINASLAQPGTPMYAAFAIKAWQGEGKRLQAMMNPASRESDDLDALGLSDNEGDDPGASFKNDADGGGNGGAEGDGNDVGSQQGRGQEHRHDHEHTHPDDDGTCGEHEKANCDAQHVHRLGQCGHKAIIHQPKDGAAHIDFIVNDQVECYMGLDSVPFGRSVDSSWPSKYKCKDVEEPCIKTCGKNVLGAAGQTSESGGSEPKILKLSEINLEGPEWNYDGGDSVDGGVMGLFKLGGDSSV